MSELLGEVPYLEGQIYRPFAEFSNKIAKIYHQRAENELGEMSIDLIDKACKFASDDMDKLGLNGIGPNNVWVILQENIQVDSDQLPHFYSRSLSQKGAQIDICFGLNVFRKLGSVVKTPDDAFMLPGLRQVFFVKEGLDELVSLIDSGQADGDMGVISLGQSFVHEVMHAEAKPRRVNDKQMLEMAKDVYVSKKRWKKSFPELQGKREAEALDQYLDYWRHETQGCEMVVSGARVFFIKQGKNKKDGLLVGMVGEVLDELIVKLFLEPEQGLEEKKFHLGIVFGIDDIDRVYRMIEMMFNDYGLKDRKARVKEFIKGAVPKMVQETGLLGLYEL